MGITAKINTAERLVEYSGKETGTASVSVDQAGKSISVDVKRNPGRMQVVHNGEVVSYDGSSDQIFSIDEELAKGSDLTQEIADRKSADELLDINITKRIEAETSDRKSSDDEIKSSVASASADLASAKSELTRAIEEEKSARLAAVGAVEGDFSALKDDVSKKVDAIDADVISYGKRLTAEEGKLLAETSERKSEDAKLAADIDSIEQILPAIDEGLESAVHKTGDETIEGTKSFSGDIKANKTITSDYDTILFAKPTEVVGDFKCSNIKADDITGSNASISGELTSATLHCDYPVDALGLTFFGTDYNSRIYYVAGDDECIGVVAKSKESSLLPMTFECSEIDVGCGILPSSDSAYALGDSSHQWSDLHAKSIWCDSVSASSIATTSVSATTLSASVVKTNIVEATDGQELLSYDGTITAIKSPMGSASVELANGDGNIYGTNIYIGSKDAESGGYTGTIKIGNSIELASGGAVITFSPIGSMNIRGTGLNVTAPTNFSIGIPPYCSDAPTSDTHLTNKSYVDKTAESQATEKANAEQERAQSEEAELRADIDILQNKHLYMHTIEFRIEDINDSEHFQTTTISVTNGSATSYTSDNSDKTIETLHSIFGENTIPYGKVCTDGILSGLLMSDSYYGLFVTQFSSEDSLKVHLATPGYYYADRNGKSIDTSLYKLCLNDYVTKLI